MHRQTVSLLGPAHIPKTGAFQEPQRAATSARPSRVRWDGRPWGRESESQDCGCVPGLLLQGALRVTAAPPRPGLCLLLPPHPPAFGAGKNPLPGIYFFWWTPYFPSQSKDFGQGSPRSEDQFVSHFGSSWQNLGSGVRCRCRSAQERRDRAHGLGPAGRAVLTCAAGTQVGPPLWAGGRNQMKQRVSQTAQRLSRCFSFTSPRGSPAGRFLTPRSLGKVSGLPPHRPFSSHHRRPSSFSNGLLPPARRLLESRGRGLSIPSPGAWNPAAKGPAWSR